MSDERVWLLLERWDLEEEEEKGRWEVAAEMLLALEEKGRWALAEESMPKP